MKRFIKLVPVYLFFKPYFFIRGRRFIWFYLLNSEGRKLYKNRLSESNSVVSNIVKELHERGIAFTSLKELFPEKDLLSELQNYAEKLKPQARVRSGKPFLKALWADDAALSLDNPFTALALNDKVLATVNGYLRMFSKFHYSSLDITTPVSRGVPPFRSQNWHRDPEDKVMCKIFVYLTDVDETAGPFVYAAGSHFGGKWNTVAPQRPPKGSYPSASLVEQKIPPEDIRVATGKAGTVIFADTAGLHRGGYATGKERLMFTAEYASKAALRPIRYNYASGFKSKDLGPAAKFAVSKKLGWLRPLNSLAYFSIRYGLN